MFCKDCGAQLAKHADFCPHCGSAQAVTSPDEPIAPPMEPDFAGKVRSAVKKMGTSTGFLIATICLTFVQLLGLFALTPTGSIFEMYHGIIPEFSIMNRNPLASLDSLSQVTDIIGMIPSILITLGLWIMFFSCASRKNKVNTSGLTMIFAVNLVQMVLSCLILLSALIPIAAIYTGAYNLLLDEDIIETVALTAGLVILIIFAFVLIYYIKVCTTISNIRSTLKTGSPNRKASRSVAILCYISGGICILSGIFSLLSAGAATLESVYAEDAISGTVAYVAYISAVSALLTAVAQILFGSLIFTYRRKMKDLEAEERILAFQTLSYAEPYTSPVYIPPEPAAEPVNEDIDETKRWDL